MTTFDADAIKALFSGVVSHAQALGIFDEVNDHIPESPPASGAAFAVWLSGIGPVSARSGLASTSVRVEFTGHIMTKARGRPLGDVDPDIMLLASDVIAAYSADLTLRNVVAEVDLLGAHGEPLGAKAEFADFSGTPLRVMEVIIPLIADDIWVQEVTP